MKKKTKTTHNVNAETKQLIYYMLALWYRPQQICDELQSEHSINVSYRTVFYYWKTKSHIKEWMQVRESIEEDPKRYLKLANKYCRLEEKLKNRFVLFFLF